jgi:hypothetical protein
MLGQNSCIRNIQEGMPVSAFTKAVNQGSNKKTHLQKWVL